MEKNNASGITRRQFCELSMIGSMYLAGGSHIAIGAEKKQEDLNADLIVIGGGGAGLMAAVSAAERGIKNIILLEKAGQPGGNTSQTGVFFAVNSPLQKRLGINVSEEQVFREKMAHDHWRQNASLIRNTIRKSGEIVQWMEDNGLKFEEIGLFAGNDAPRVGHKFKGPSGIFGRLLVKTLSTNCLKQGIKILCDTSAKEILIDKNGAVTGILAATKDKEKRITAKGVIIASGGFARNKELIKKYFPSQVDYLTSSLEQMTGDGLLMAEKVGAIVDDQLSILVVGPLPVESPPHIGLHRQHYMVAVNKDGERYFDESLRLHYNIDDETNTLGRQRDKEFYALLDSAMMQEAARETAAAGGVGDVAEEKDSQKNSATEAELLADTWEEIAGFIGSDLGVLKKTVARYNSFCEKGRDDDFFKDPKYLRPLDTPPYLAVRVRYSVNTTFGGIKINHRTEVLNKLDLPIKGLYAAGDCAGSWAPLTYSHRYPGSASSFALCSGSIAGENAAEYISTI